LVAGAFAGVFAGAAFAGAALAGVVALVAALAGAAGFAATLLAAGAAFAGAAFATGFVSALAAGTFTLCMDGPFFSVAGALAVSFFVSSVFFLLNNAITDLHSNNYNISSLILTQFFCLVNRFCLFFSNSQKLFQNTLQQSAFYGTILLEKTTRREQNS
jgi:hypothetical protein